MNEKREIIRKTISLDKELISTCEVLYGEAGVDNFTQFAASALQMYTEYLLSQKQRPLLAREVRKAIKDEVRPIRGYQTVDKVVPNGLLIFGIA